MRHYLKAIAASGQDQNIVLGPVGIQAFSEVLHEGRIIPAARLPMPDDAHLDVFIQPARMKNIGAAGRVGRRDFIIAMVRAKDGAASASRIQGVPDRHERGLFPNGVSFISRRAACQVGNQGRRMAGQIPIRELRHVVKKNWVLGFGMALDIRDELAQGLGFPGFSSTMRFATGS